MEIFLTILITVLILAVIAAVIGVLLALAGKFFAVDKDERIDKIADKLAGANCGGCGYSGCAAYATAIVEEGAATNLCPAAGEKATREIAAIMGREVTESVRMRAQVLCSGTHQLSNLKYNYRGLDDCLSVARLGNGPKECPFGCIGLGTCVKACKFGAIKVERGVAVVEYEKCVGCGVCANSCPQKIIELVPFDTEIWVGCRSKDKGAVVRKLCQVGCIGCGICAKNCPNDAITVENGVAHIDYAKCTACGVCVEKCPRKIIWSGKEQVMFGDTIVKESLNYDQA